MCKLIMDKFPFFLILFSIWFFVNNKRPPSLLVLFLKMYYSIYNSLTKKQMNSKSITESIDDSIKPIIKYEEKYLEEFRKIPIQNIDELDKVKQIEHLKICFVMEYTPLGNVLMVYDSDRETFKYYSDNVIPYRFLETVGRKYVKQFHCKYLFVDIDVELRLSEEKCKLSEEKIVDTDTKVLEPKKNVFTKFKNYNKDTTIFGKINTTKNNTAKINQSKQSGELEKPQVLLKDRSNRYNYDGNISNFNFLKKIDRKIVDKKYGMSFSDFKKMQE